MKTLLLALLILAAGATLACDNTIGCHYTRPDELFRYIVQFADDPVNDPLCITPEASAAAYAQYSSAFDRLRFGPNMLAPCFSGSLPLCVIDFGTLPCECIPNCLQTQALSSIVNTARLAS